MSDRRAACNATAIAAMGDETTTLFRCCCSAIASTQAFASSFPKKLLPPDLPYNSKE